ncbi:MAG: hypothetical protein AAF599_21250, partial [Bacteroidota bacterium]
MMKRIIQVILICYPYFLLGQNYLDYYAQVNQAKKLVLQKEYQQALETYKNVFQTFDFEFARDCIHAVEIANLLEEEELSFYFATHALKRGVSIDYFVQEGRYEAFRATSSWKKLLTASDSLQQLYLNSINLELRAEINEMFRADQAIRDRYYKWYNFLWRLLIGKKWKKLNLEQVERIVEITEQVGFPGERCIGIDLSEYHTNIERTQLSAGMPIVILIHHYSQPNLSYDSLFFQHILEGNLYNEHFATICDFESK